MDLPLSAARVALVQNTAYFSTATLTLLQLFFVKLDMVFTHPLHAFGGEHSLREMLLMERGLSTLWDILRDTPDLSSHDDRHHHRGDRIPYIAGSSQLTVLRLWVKHRYTRPRSPPRPMDHPTQSAHERKAAQPIMGIPASLVGRGGRECWGLGARPLLRPEELVQREGLRRGLGLQRMLLHAIAAGYLSRDLRPLQQRAPGAWEVVPSRMAEWRWEVEMERRRRAAMRGWRRGERQSDEGGWGTDLAEDDERAADTDKPHGTSIRGWGRRGDEEHDQDIFDEDDWEEEP